MEAAQYSDKKAEREQKIAALEAEKASLQFDVIAMREKLAQLEYEKSVRTLQGEIEALRTERTALEENTRAYEAEAQDIGGNTSASPTIQTGPSVAVGSGHVPTGPAKVEQARPLRDAVPNRNPIQQRPSPQATFPRPAGIAPTQGVKPKVNQ